MMILALVHNYIPSYRQRVEDGWSIPDCVARSRDVEGMHVGALGAGRIGLAVLLRLKTVDVHLHYFDRYRLPVSVERELDLTWHPTVEDLVKVCDVISIHAPLHSQTENLFDEKLISTMKRGAYLVNTTHGKICDRDAVFRAIGERAACRFRGRRLVSTAGAQGPSLADDAASRRDAARLRDVPLVPGPLRSRNARDPRMLVRGPADSERIPDRRWRQARWRRCAFLQRRQCNKRVCCRSSISIRRRCSPVASCSIRCAWGAATSRGWLPTCAGCSAPADPSRLRTALARCRGSGDRVDHAAVDPERSAGRSRGLGRGDIDHYARDLFRRRGTPDDRARQVLLYEGRDCLID